MNRSPAIPTPLSSFTDSMRTVLAVQFHIDDFRVGALDAARFGKAAQVLAHTTTASNWNAYAEHGPTCVAILGGQREAVHARREDRHRVVLDAELRYPRHAGATSS
jgi:hypothetical protein